MRARRARLRLLVASILTAAATSACAAAPQTTGAPPPEVAPADAALAASATIDFDKVPSIRAAFFYPWFPETWAAPNGGTYTNYTPTAGLYDSGLLSTMARQVDELVYARVDVAISSWWGPGTPTATRFEKILTATTTKRIQWAIYYEREGYGNPSAAEIVNDLRPLVTAHATNTRLFRLGGQFVVFVYAGANDNCAMASRWVDASNQLGIYIVLKVFGGYRQCASQPDAWHQYAPAVATDAQSPWSYSVSPGFWLYGEGVRLARDPAAFRRNVQSMVAAKPKFQLITTFNEWGEGTSVEPAQQWPSPSGKGIYLDILHDIPPR